MIKVQKIINKKFISGNIGFHVEKCGGTKKTQNMEICSVTKETDEYYLFFKRNLEVQKL